MELHTIEVKKYKSSFFQTLLINILTLIGSIILIGNGVYILEGFDPGKKFTLPILIALLILAAAHTLYQKKQLNKLALLDDFEERLMAYEKFYKFRMVWFLFSCLISCLLAILTSRYLFIYFGAIDILISISFYPTLLLFKRELRQDEIILV